MVTWWCVGAKACLHKEVKNVPPAAPELLLEGKQFEAQLDHKGPQDDGADHPEHRLHDAVELQQEEHQVKHNEGNDAVAHKCTGHKRANAHASPHEEPAAAAPAAMPPLARLVGAEAALM